MIFPGTHTWRNLGNYNLTDKNLVHVLGREKYTDIIVKDTPSRYSAATTYGVYACADYCVHFSVNTDYKGIAIHPKASLTQLSILTKLYTTDFSVCLRTAYTRKSL